MNVHEGETKSKLFQNLILHIFKCISEEMSEEQTMP